MRLPLYQVDAFTSEVFRGNPAAVCPLETWLPDATMQAIAAENNLAETAFFVPTGPAQYHLRWFTPEVEVDLCGHGTLASAAVLYEKPHSVVQCNYVWKRTDRWINFPWSDKAPVAARAGATLDA